MSTSIDNDFLLKLTLFQIRSQHGMTALHKAAQNGHTEVVRVLLDKGAKINIKNDVSIISIAM